MSVIMMQLRPCTTADLDAVVELNETVYAALPDKTVLRHNSAEMMASCLVKPNLTLGYWDDDVLVAIGVLYVPQCIEEDHAHDVVGYLTVGQIDCGTMGRIDCGTMGRIDCGTMGRIDCGTLGQIDCGTLGQIDFGTFGTLSGGYRAAVAERSRSKSKQVEASFCGLGDDVVLGLDDLAKMGIRAANQKLFLVREGYRGQGLQQKLIREIEKIAVARGYNLLCTTCAPNNAFSINNFLKEGYRYAMTEEKYGGLVRNLYYKVLEK